MRAGIALGALAWAALAAVLLLNETAKLEDCGTGGMTAAGRLQVALLVAAPLAGVAGAVVGRRSGRVLVAALAALVATPVVLFYVLGTGLVSGCSF